MRRSGRCLALFGVALIAWIGGPRAVASGATKPATRGGAHTTLTLTSAAFAPRGDIPPRHTCDAEDLSPPLAWSGAPRGTKSFALIVDDPDAPDPAAPKMTWVHWVLYNLSAQTAVLGEGMATRRLPAGALEGLNDWKKPGYRGPCPPVGKHRYVHKLYALDTVLPDLRRPTKAALEAAMKGHVLARAELVGLYQRH